MELEVLSRSGEPTGRKVNLDAEVFGIEPNDHVMYLEVKRHLASLRQGTHKSKERSEITGSTKKLRRQKGTGAARVGDIKNPIFRGGGRAFGPRPRFYDQKLNKKVIDLAKRSALSLRAKEEVIKVVEDFDFESPKTKEYKDFLNKVGVEGKKVLHLRERDADNVWLSARNLKGSEVRSAASINAYELLNHNYLILSEKAVEVLLQSLKK